MALRVLSQTHTPNKKVLWDRTVVFAFCCCFLLFSRALTGSGEVAGHAAIRCPLLDVKGPYMPQALLHEGRVKKLLARMKRSGAREVATGRIPATRQTNGKTSTDRRRMLGRALTLERGPLADDPVETHVVTQNLQLPLHDDALPSVTIPDSDAPSLSPSYSPPLATDPSLQPVASELPADSASFSEATPSPLPLDWEEMPFVAEVPDDATDGLETSILYPDDFSTPKDADLPFSSDALSDDIDALEV